MDISLEVSSPDAADQLRSLHEWLAGDIDFRGRVRLVEGKPEPGTLAAGIPELVVVALGSLASSKVLANVLVTWIRSRTSDVTCRATRPDGSSFEVTTTHLRNADLRAQQEITRELAESLIDGDVAKADDA